MAVTVIKNYTRRVVAPKKSKTGLIIGIALLIGGGIGVLAWYLHNKKKPTNNTDSGSDTSTETTKDETSKDAISQIDITAKSGTPIIVKDDKPKDTLTFQKWANVNKNAGLKEDGQFGAKTKKIWDLYKNEFQKLIATPTFAVSTVLTVKAPLTKSVAYDKFFKNIGNFSKAKFVSDFDDKYIIAEVTVPKGLSFETKTVYLLRKDWIKA